MPDFSNYQNYNQSPVDLPYGKTFKKICIFFQNTHQSLLPNGTLIIANRSIPFSLTSLNYIAKQFGFSIKSTNKNNITYIKKVAKLSKNPLVSILIPAHRHEFLFESIQSALNQTYPHTEIIISDDSETNHIYEVVSSIQSNKIKYFKCENKKYRVCY